MKIKVSIMLYCVSLLTFCGKKTAQENAAITNTVVIITDTVMSPIMDTVADKAHQSVVREININTDSSLVSTDNVKIVLWGLYENETESKQFEFNNGTDNDTIFLQNEFYNGIENLQIQFLSDDISVKTLTGEITYGVYFYWFDGGCIDIDDFAFKDTVQIAKEGDKYVILSVVRDFRSLDTLFGKNYFNDLRAAAYASQKEYIQKYYLNRKDEYKKCCPEYIERIDSFFSKKEADLKTMDDLRLCTFDATYAVCKRISLNLGNNKYLVVSHYAWR